MFVNVLFLTLKIFLLIQTNVIFVGFLIVFLFSLVEVLNKCSVSWLCSMRVLSNIVFHGFVL